jgi:uncharacterized protein YigE (DUF2233 family)
MATHVRKRIGREDGKNEFAINENRDGGVSSEGFKPFNVYAPEGKEQAELNKKDVYQAPK